ncbi:MAG: hypothetical protein NTW04_01685, partial [Elusimicrobia bacterium]|nr:hypothetical protein [Elusimicrobiota bacterium]
PALQQILGHYSLKMTQRYAHLAKGHLSQTINTFAAGMPVLDRHQYGHQSEIKTPSESVESQVCIGKTEFSGL